MSGNVRGGAAKAGADTASPLVVIVEDDEGVREGLQDLLRSVGLDTLAYGATSELLAATLPDRPGCLILDVRLPGSSGLDLQAKLAALGNRMPIIFMTGHGDIPMTVQAMKAGALEALAATLTTREAEVMAHVVKGLLNKQIAYALGISEITVKIHRGNVMRKMEAGSVADLVRKTELLKARATV